MRILITGGLGFIGTNLIHHFSANPGNKIMNMDAHTVAVEDTFSSARLRSKNVINSFGNICDPNFVKSNIFKFKPHIILNLAAESHVDFSIADPGQAIKSNIGGVAVLLDAATEFWKHSARPNNFCFLQFSTDEVYGDIGNKEFQFSEHSDLEPSSPYSASKASADLLVKAWNRTYSLPYLITRCSNNYGCFQAKSKFLPKLIHCLVKEHKFTLYGDGTQRRDWIHVSDCVFAIEELLRSGIRNETFNIGTGVSKSNIEVANNVVELVASFSSKPKDELKNLIQFGADRPGHDLKYEVDASKLRAMTNWHQRVKFDDGVRSTVQWYLSMYRG